MKRFVGQKAKLPDDSIFERIRNNFPSSPSVEVKIVGGELFQDPLLPKFLPFYERVVNFVREIDHGQEVKVSMTSNFLFTKNQEVRDFLTRNGVGISCSFDFYGRFGSDSQIERVFHNLSELRQNLTCVQLVGMIPNFESVESADPLWLRLYNSYDTEFNMAEKSTPPHLRPSEQRIAQFFIHCLEHYPKVGNLRDILSPQPQQLCRHGASCSWFADSAQCCDHDEIVPRFLKNKRCLSCPYYRDCGLSCFNLFHDQEFCYVREVKNYSNFLSKRQSQA